MPLTALLLFCSLLLLSACGQKGDLVRPPLPEAEQTATQLTDEIQPVADTEQHIEPIEDTEQPTDIKPSAESR